MQVGIMITNGGVHPADKWAAQSASRIVSLIEVDENSQSDEARVARRAKPRLELDLADALEGHHDTVQTGEREALIEHGPVRYDHSLDADEHHGETLSDAMATINEIVSKTPFAEAFQRPEIQDAVRGIIAGHFSHAMNIERSWHRDLGGKTFDSKSGT